jgi:hypothetical protein
VFALARGAAAPPTRPQPRNHPNPPPRSLRNSARDALTPSYLRIGLGAPSGLAVVFTPGVAVGIAVGEGTGELPGAALAAPLETVPAVTPGFGVGARIPDGMPGAAGRTPSALASVEPVLFGAGPTVAGRLTEPLG